MAAKKKSSLKFKPSEDDDAPEPEQNPKPNSAVKRAVISNVAGQPPPSEEEAAHHGKLLPDFFYRLSECPKYFGYQLTVLNEKIANDEIPMPVSLSDSGRAKGWFGRTIIKWQREREEKAKIVHTKE